MEPIYTVLYVRDVPASVAFYRTLFGTEPIEDHPTFAMFAFRNGTTWGLWQRSDVLPEVSAASEPGSLEFGFAVSSRDALDALAAEWEGRGIAIAQHPTDLDFGYTFTALDPDGHRLRPFFPATHTAAAKMD